MDKASFLSAIETAGVVGVVGEGGAGFPSHVKYRATVETVIGNGCECEPLLHTDRHLMIRHATEVVAGLDMLGEAVDASRRVLAVKRKQTEAIAVLRAVIADRPIELALLDDFYPAGDEQIPMRGGEVLRNLLVVVDTPIIRSTILRIVKGADLGYTSLFEACNGAEAIETARIHPPDVVIMDIRMPGVDGLEAAAVIRREHPRARIVFLSAYDDFAYVQRALKLGAVDYLLKPVRPSALRELLRSFGLEGADLGGLPSVTHGTETAGRSDPVQRAVAYIRQNYRSPTISLAEVSEAAHLSTSHLAHRFRQKVGVGYQQYVTSLRIEAAKTLLATTDLPVGVVAEDVGYPNLTNFYRLFQRETAATPAAFRREARRTAEMAGKGEAAGTER